MWLNHHTMLSAVTRVNRAVLVLNLFLLMGVVAIPFPTALVADHLNGERRRGQVAAVSYGLVMIAISIGYASTWIYLAGASGRTGRPPPGGAGRGCPCSASRPGTPATWSARSSR